MVELVIPSGELIANPATRIPVCLVLDTSGSMSGEPIVKLRKALKSFITDILQNDVSKAATDLAVITFGSKVLTLSDFQNVKPGLEIEFAAGGKTPLGEAIGLANQLVARRTALYQGTGVEYHKPWVVLLTDGAPTDSIESSVAETIRAIENNKINFFPVAVGEYADMDVLKRFSPNRAPLVLAELKFNEFFSWLSESVQRVSESMPGEEIKLPPVAPWKDLSKK